MSKLNTVIEELKERPINLDFQKLLKHIIEAFDCTTGTIHTLDEETKLLKLRAQQGIPDTLLSKMSEIPIGKGMAGIAAERRTPVEMCNLQTDGSGMARPAARETKVEGSIAAPMLFEGRLYGTLGIAKPDPYDFTEEENKNILEIGEQISRVLHEKGSNGL